MSRQEEAEASETRDGEARFRARFERWAARVRRRLALRHGLTGAALGLAIATLPAAAAWRAGHGALRTAAPVVGAVGTMCGLAVARRRRWSDGDVALYLDEQLGTQEAIATAVELADEASSSETARAARATVTARATIALGPEGDARAARPRVWKPVHVAGPVAVAALVLIGRAPLPAATAGDDARGARHVQISDARALEAVEKLATLPARDAAQRERLDAIAREASSLREALRAGVERREAQDRMARIADAIAAERLSLGDGERRAGLESAVGRLDAASATKRAAAALGDHDLARMDAEMERLANARESEDRGRARTALKDAADAAKRGGAADVGGALDEAGEAMDRRAARADALRELEQALADGGASSDALRSESEALEHERSDEAARRLARALGEALATLTPEQRQRVAAKLREAARREHAGSDREARRKLADALATPEGQAQLEAQLEELARGAPEPPEAQRQEALDEARAGVGRAEDELRGGPPGGEGSPGTSGADGRGAPLAGGAAPRPGAAAGAGGGPGGSAPIPAPQAGAGGGGGASGGASGPHEGETKAIDAPTLRSRATGRLRRGAAMTGAVTTLTPGRAGGTANERGMGDLRAVGPSEIDGVDRSDVPEEYRDHVRQYFEP